MPFSLSATVILDLAGLALAVSIIANFTKRFVQLAVARFSPDTQAALVRAYIYCLSYGVVLFTLVRTGHWNQGTALADAVGPAFSVFIAAVASYHVLNLETSPPDDSVSIPPGHALALIPFQSLPPPATIDAATPLNDSSAVTYASVSANQPATTTPPVEADAVVVVAPTEDTLPKT